MQQIRKRNIIEKASGNIVVLLTLLILASCGNNKLVDSYETMPDNQWAEESVAAFSFEITETANTYDVYFTIKNGIDYPFHNLYVDYQVLRIDGETETVVEKGLKEYMLFDPKTGKPYGSGSSGWYDHEFLIDSNYRFDEAGSYEIRFQQYMRKESLISVATVGFALATHQPDDD